MTEVLTLLALLVAGVPLFGWTYRLWRGNVLHNGDSS